MIDNVAYVEEILLMAKSRISPQKIIGILESEYNLTTDLSYLKSDIFPHLKDSLKKKLYFPGGRI